MSINCSTGLATLTACQGKTGVGSIQRKLPVWSGWGIQSCRPFFFALFMVLLSVFLQGAAQAAVVTVNVLTDEVEDSCPTTCSIRSALASANAGDEIQFAVTGTIVLAQGELVVDKDLTITGPGAESLALDGNSASRVLAVQPDVTATIKGLTIQNGYSRSESEEPDTGGGINNKGTLTLTNGTLSGNSAEYHGGIIYSDGTLILARSIIAHSPSGENCSGGGEFISEGDNLSSDATCITADSTLNDRNNTDPFLDSAGLQDNGGPTLTIALQPVRVVISARWR